jgi:hypothetical protein
MDSNSERFACSDISSRKCIVLAVADASGRYVPSFFWGNSYWTGSESLCYQLNSNESRLEAPPFRLGFYTVRLQITLPEYISSSVSMTAGQSARELRVFINLFLSIIAFFVSIIAEFATKNYENVRNSFAMSVCLSPCNRQRVTEFSFVKSGIGDLPEIC